MGGCHFCRRAQSGWQGEATVPCLEGQHTACPGPHKQGWNPDSTNLQAVISVPSTEGLMFFLEMTATHKWDPGQAVGAAQHLVSKGHTKRPIGELEVRD